MKRFLLFVPVIALCLTACVEVPPVIDFSVPVELLKDTTYTVTPAPAPQHKAVVIEDVTGVRCINCPDAAEKAHEIVNQKSEDSVVIVAQYPDQNILMNFTYPWPGVPQLGNALSTQIVESLGTPQGLPTGYVDRKIFPGKTQRDINYQEWINYVNQRLREKTPVNIHLSKVVKDRNLKVEMKLEYNAAVSTGSHKYVIYLLESNIVSTQLDHSGENHNYVHNHAMRYSFGPAMGTSLTGPYPAGKTFLKQFEFEVPAEYVMQNCTLVCMVLDANGSEEVINVRAIHL